MKNFEDIAGEFLGLYNKREDFDKLKKKPFPLAQLQVLNTIYAAEIDLRIIDEQEDPSCFISAGNVSSEVFFERFHEFMSSFRPKLRLLFKDVQKAENFDELYKIVKAFIDQDLIVSMGSFTILRLHYSADESPNKYRNLRCLKFRDSAFLENTGEKIFEWIRSFVKFHGERKEINVLMRDCSFYMSSGFNFEQELGHKIYTESAFGIPAQTFMLYPEFGEYRDNDIEEAFTKFSSEVPQNFIASSNFDCMVYFTSNINSYREPVEYHWLLDHTAKGGLCIVIIPSPACTESRIKAITSRLKNVNVLCEDNGYVVFVGKKREKYQNNIQDQFDVMDQIMNKESRNTDITIECHAIKPIRFRSVIVSLADIENLYETKNSSVTDIVNSINTKVKSKDKEEEKRPMIPFSAGQLGLALVSGYIDGVVKDSDDNYHLIKGSTHRETNYEQEYTDENTLEERRTTSSVTSVNVFLADGTFLSL